MRNIWLGVFAVLALTFSVVILTAERNQAVNGVCDALRGNCETVQQSAYGKVFGIDMSIIGVAAFGLLTLMIALSFWLKDAALEWAILAGCLSAGVIAIYLVFVQVAILRMYCVYCLVVDGSSLVLCGIAVTRLMRRREPSIRQL